MRRLLCLILLFAPAVMASQITIDVPNAIGSNATDICEDFRQDLRVRASTWSLKVCAEELLRVGLRVTLRDQILNEGNAATQASARTARNQFDSAFPQYGSVPGRTSPPVRMFCGDGTLDNDVTIPYVEECDDGNTEDGDGCSSDCIIE